MLNTIQKWTDHSFMLKIKFYKCIGFCFLVTKDFSLVHITGIKYFIMLFLKNPQRAESWWGRCYQVLFICLKDIWTYFGTTQS